MYFDHFTNYVPQPDPAVSSYLLAAHYYPGWKPGGATNHNGFADLHTYPERTPLMGYYDESLPEVTDWEIKWALEHGIGCFIYCWYRYKSNVGHPVTRQDLRLGHALHDGLFQARYGNMMKFAIMWEGHSWGVAQDKNDLLHNLMPFWMENYFTKPNYLVLDNKPVLFIYDYAGHVFDAFGTTEAFAEALRACEDIARGYGFDGMTFCSEYRYDQPEKLEFYKQCGYRHSFAYCWHTQEQHPTQEQAMEEQLNLMRQRVERDAFSALFTCSVGWDPRPWTEIFHMQNVTSWKLTPKNWRKLLREVKSLADSMPRETLGSKLIMLDNWNEWSEGHFIAPHLDGGFQYLQAVREVFCDQTNLPDYRLPLQLGLGSYENGWKMPNNSSKI